MLIGREKEIAKLNHLYNGDSAELVAIYGRRRVGKTFLVDEVFSDRITFRHAGLSPVEGHQEDAGRNKMKDQLEHFFRSLQAQGLKATHRAKSWLEAFYMLETLLMEKEKTSSGRLLVFLDEIQWMDTPKSGFMTGLEAFWNGWACHRHNVMVVVCGSSSSWILDKLVHNHGGLYGRVTCQINLLPFSLHECEEFFRAKGIELSRYDIAQAYMIVGGIPYYLNYFSREMSLSQNIQALFFDPSAPLADEFQLMFSSLFARPGVMQSIVRAVNTRNRGLTRSELVKLTGLPEGGDVGKYLQALIAGTFMIKYDSFGNGKRESYYKLVDPFCLFYLKFMDGNTGKRGMNWVNLSDTQSVISWRGLAFENVCFNHIPQIKASLGISGVSTSESLWSKRGDEDAEGTQIDLIINRRDNVVNMCEIKFYSDEFLVTKDYHFTLERRKRLLREHIPKKATIHNILITTFGVIKREFFGDFIQVITLDDLFTS